MASINVNIFIAWFLIATITNNVNGSQRESTKSKDTNAPLNSSGANRNSIEIEENRSGPYYDKTASKNITALVGKTAYLNCRVKNLGNKTMLLQVSWVRHRDIHLLTVGRYTYTSDQRFRAIHHPQTEDWILQIKYPQHRDSGIYECQVSTTPHMSHFVHLNVIEPTTEIIGAPDLYIEAGSTINLTCVILHSPEPPAYIFWNHNNAIINYDSPRGGVSVVTNKGETTTSFLLIKNARASDSGQYQCNPSNARSKSVSVHVLNGVSHSVSRGIPSSNAARGPSSSSHVATSLPFSLFVNIFIYFSIYYTTPFYMHKTNVTLCILKCILKLPINFFSLVLFQLSSVINSCSKPEDGSIFKSIAFGKGGRPYSFRSKSLTLNKGTQCKATGEFYLYSQRIFWEIPRLQRLCSSTTTTTQFTHSSSRKSSSLTTESVVK